MMGLDPQSTADIINYMQEHAKKGNTVFFSSHNLDIVKKLCHRVAIVSHGRLVETIELAGNSENQDRLEEIFFKSTGGGQSKVIIPTEPLVKNDDVVTED
jgi:ABC-2 type transport system ATP-binding protein